MSTTVVITAHTPRVKSGLLQRAINSVLTQTHIPDAIAVAIDHYHQGAAVTRNRALFMANTEWIVFLDSDDILYSNYMFKVFSHQVATGADVVWPWFDVDGAGDPFPMHFNRQWDPEAPHIFPITTLVRRELAVAVGGFPEDPPVSKICAGEDFPFWKKLSAAGAKFSHLPERLWQWNHRPAGGNTSGLGSRW
jgi:glycosyltransferase involved in cell wall biosynthesis